MFKKLSRLSLVALLVVSMVHVELKTDKNRPIYPLLVYNENVEWNEEEGCWIDHNVYFDNWIFLIQDVEQRNKVIAEYRKPIRTPVHKTLIITFRENYYRNEETYASLGSAAVLETKRQRRFVLINVDSSPVNETQYRLWPHLGILYVGTAAYEEGWDVVLWDELIQGPCDIKKLVKPGDIVGLSMLASFTERGVELAREGKSKDVRARYVIAGNDAAIFRARQLLELPDKPIDAVFTSNSTNAVRQFFREIGSKDISEIAIREVATSPENAVFHSNDSETLTLEFLQRKKEKPDNMDGFLVPKFDLYCQDYWEQAWRNYRAEYGHKHAHPKLMRGSLIQLAQGCTRTQGKEACSYCTIFGVADLRYPKDEMYLATLVERYQSMGLNNLYNVTDSAYEMTPLIKMLKNIGFKTTSLEIYARAWGLATHPRLLEDWLSFCDERLLLNCGMDSGDERMLEQGIIKAHVGKGSRLKENKQAIKNLKGSGAHLYYSVIMGSPGESRDSCKRTLEFIGETLVELGTQLDLVEADIYWLNFGSAASRVFYDFEYAQKLAAMAGKTITQDHWYQDFAQHANALSVPWSVEQAWYHRFTQIDVETAYEYQAQVRELTSQHPGHIHPRDYAFKPPEDKA